MELIEQQIVTRATPQQVRRYARKSVPRDDVMRAATYGFQLSRGAAASVVSPGWSPLNVASANPYMWIRADISAYEAGGVGTGVSHLLDQSSAGNDAAQATLGVRPTLNATGGPDGTACISSGGTRWMLSEWNPASPSTAPFYVMAIIRVDTWTNSTALFGGQSGTRCYIRNNSVSGSILCNSGSVGAAVAATPGTWYALRAHFTGSASDFLKIGANTSAAGTFGVNGVIGGWGIFSNNVGGGVSTCSLAELMVWDSIPTEPELDEYLADRYPSAVLG